MKRFFPAILFCISSLTATCQDKGILIRLDKKIKGKFKANLQLVHEEFNTTWDFQEKQLTGSIFFAGQYDTGDYFFSVSNDNRLIIDTMRFTIKEEIPHIVYAKVRNYEIEEGDTVNRYDDQWRMHGRWTKSEFRGFYKNGMKHGFGRENAMEGIYINGKREGVWSDRFYGPIQALFTYKNGKRHGPANFFHPNGKIRAIYEYRNGRLWNVLVLYDTSGNQLPAGSLKNGTGSLILYNDNMKEFGTDNYTNGIRNGICWEQYGHIKFIRTYRNEELIKEEQQTLYSRYITLYKNRRGIRQTIYFTDSVVRKITVPQIRSRSHGERQLYDSAGKLILTEYYFHSVLYKAVFFFPDGCVKSSGRFGSYQYGEHGGRRYYKQGEWKEFSEDGKKKYIITYNNNKEQNRIEINIKSHRHRQLQSWNQFYQVYNQRYK